MKKLFDLEYLHEITGGDDDFEQELLATFLDQAPQFMIRLQELLDAKKYPEMTPVAHKYKSSLTVFGLYDIYNKILKVESDTRAGINLEGLQDLLNEIKQLTEQAMKELKEEMHP